MRDMEPTVFIVDNDTPVLKSLEALMQSVRLRVEIYLFAEDFFRNYDGVRPGCLILDVRMPKISGIEVYRQLRRKGSDIPVIFLTGHAEVATAVGMMREGAFDFLEKPCH
jgi:two-component system response regulator FixJ